MPKRSPLANVMLSFAILATGCLTSIGSPVPPAEPVVVTAPEDPTLRVEQEEHLVEQAEERIATLSQDPEANAEALELEQLYRRAVLAEIERSKDRADDLRYEVDVVADSYRINNKCRRARNNWTDKKVDFGKKERRLKLVFGAVTGGVGTAGGAVAGITAGIDQKEAATWTGGATALLGLAGTLATSLVTPDKEELQKADARIRSIDGYQEEMRKFLAENPNPKKWNDAVKAQWAAMVGRADSDCT